MAKVILAARIILGLLFVVFGSDFFLGFLVHFMPEMEAPTAEGMDFFEALTATGYMFPLIKITEIAVGLMLLTGRLVPLALTLIAPIIVNILLYHLLLDNNGLMIALGLLVLEVFLAWSYRDSFRGVLALKAQPSH